MSTNDRTTSSLRPWLFELIGGDADRRAAAADALGRRHTEAMMARWHAGGSVSSAGRVADAYARAVQSALTEPEVDAAAYVRHLAAFMREADARRMGLWKAENDRSDRVVGRIAAQLDAPDVADDRRATLNRRLTRAICSGGDPESASAKGQDHWLKVQLAVGSVFAALGPLALRAPEVVSAMIRDRGSAFQAAALIESLGPAAEPFAGDLFAWIDAPDAGYDSAMIAAMAAAFRDNAPAVYRLLARLGVDVGAAAALATSVLWSIGPRAAELVPDVVATLLAHARDGRAPARPGAAAAAGRIAHGDASAVDALLALSDDPDVWVRGAALSALGDVGRRPDVVVPRLVRALDDYDEQDPDLGYHSAHERVATALRAFGPDAAAAVPALAARLRIGDADEEQVDTTVARALGAIGPAAAAALPELVRLATERGWSEGDPDDETDALNVAIRRIRGVPTSPS